MNFSLSSTLSIYLQLLPRYLKVYVPKASENDLMLSPTSVVTHTHIYYDSIMDVVTQNQDLEIFFISIFTFSLDPYRENYKKLRLFKEVEKNTIVHDLEDPTL